MSSLSFLIEIASQSVEDIVSSNPIFIRNILLDCLPFEGTDPLSAGRRRNATVDTTAQSISDPEELPSEKHEGNGIEERTYRSHEEQSCMSLAQRIIGLAKDRIKLEVYLQFQEKSLLQNVHT